MNRIIILIILISFSSCKKGNEKKNTVKNREVKTEIVQKKDSLSDFSILSQIDRQIQLRKTTQSTYKTLDSLKRHIDGADAEYYIEVYKNAILNDTKMLKNHYKTANINVDYDVLDFFSQDIDIISQICENIHDIIGDYYVLAEIEDKDGFVNLRSKENLNSKIIIKIDSGELVKVLNRENDWWLVLYKNKVGYIHESRLKIGDSKGD